MMVKPGKSIHLAAAAPAVPGHGVPPALEEVFLRVVKGKAA